VFKDEHRMSRSEQRRLALHFSLCTIAWLACLFVWVAVLTFDVADWPSTTVWPQRTPPNNWCGFVGSWFAYQLLYHLGAGTYATLLLITAAIAAWTHHLRLPDLWLRCLGVGLVCTAVSTAGAMFLTPSDHFLVSGPGGLLGTAAAHFLHDKLQTPGTLIVVTCAFVVGLILAADEVVLGLLRWFIAAGKRSAPAVVRSSGQVLADAAATVASGVSHVSGRLATAGAELLPSRAPRGPSPAPRKPAGQLTLDLDDEAPQDEAETADEPGEGESLEAAVASEPDAVREPPSEATRASPRITALGPGARDAQRRATESHRPVTDTDYELPSLARLADPEPVDRQSVEILCREKAFVLEQTLNEFRLEVQVVAIETGPVITVFELKLAPGIKVSQIASLANDMARALKAPAVRVVAPLPGKNTIGIEVPNVDKEKVRLKDLMLQAPARAKAYAVPLYLGKDASGQPLVSDLTRMPHLLIAGTTGSGKSVCIASMITSILMTRTPAEVNLILVDPKVVELAMFKNIPHLMCPIVTEVSRAEAILDWAATKMDERYALLAEAGVKDIRSYNQLGEQELRQRMQVDSDEEMQRIPVRLPYIVIVIDELADLMMTSAKEVEFFLCRLAQKSRAVGIHLLVSTQRPQANVVTGLIKSNMPCRIGFRVASRLDSRIVLDQNGGEALMGMGDMLFLPPGSAKLIRAQGTFVAEDEARAVVEHVRAQAKPDYHPELIRMPKADGEGTGERDELFDQSVDIIIETGRGSVSLLQRRLMIGYGRASRLIDQMYEAGIVGEYKGSQAREVLMPKDDWEAVKAARNREEAAEERGFED
jgi:S-DNA-T family DNA segregation ATPase FtsK/SpoIIIE